MKKLINIIIIAMSCLFTSSVWAAGLENTLTLTVVNNTQETLTFNNVEGQVPTNQFTITSQVIAPGNKTVIIGQTSAREDLAADIHFWDSAGHDNILFVLDPLSFSAKLPTFEMKNIRFRSTAKFIPNKEIGNFLKTKEAEVSIIPAN